MDLRWTFGGRSVDVGWTLGGRWVMSLPIPGSFFVITAASKRIRRSSCRFGMKKMLFAWGQSVQSGFDGASLGPTSPPREKKENPKSSYKIHTILQISHLKLPTAPSAFFAGVADGAQAPAGGLRSAAPPDHKKCAGASCSAIFIALQKAPAHFLRSGPQKMCGRFL